MQSVNVTPKPRGALKISLSVRATSAKLEEQALNIEENGTYHTPNGVRYNPISVNVKAVDIPLTLTDNGTTEAPDGVRYTPITVNMPKPTLNAPKIEFNANGGYMYILDSKNGNFSEGYQLYLNGEENVVLTSTNIKMQDYGITETDEVGIVAKSAFFNNSPMATARWSDLELGTIGLTYSGNTWTGLGTATETEIYVASIVNGTKITAVGGSRAMQGLDGYKITLPRSIESITDALRLPQKCTFIFSGNVTVISNNAFLDSKYCIFDFSNSTVIPTIGTTTFGGPANDIPYATSGSINCKYIAPDNLYDNWIVATNWANKASQIIKKSIWDASGGTV